METKEDNMFDKEELDEQSIGIGVPEMANATLEDTALNYEEKKTKNVTDLDEITRKEKIGEFEGIDQTGKPFSYKYIERDGQRYRLPVSVIVQIKALIEDSPEITKFRVKKKGEGMKRRYTVIPVV